MRNEPGCPVAKGKSATLRRPCGPSSARRDDGRAASALARRRRPEEPAGRGRRRAATRRATTTPDNRAAADAPANEPVHAPWPRPDADGPYEDDDDSSARRRRARRVASARRHKRLHRRAGAGSTRAGSPVLLELRTVNKAEAGPEGALSPRTTTSRSAPSSARGSAGRHRRDPAGRRIPTNPTQMSQKTTCGST